MPSERRSRRWLFAALLLVLSVGLHAMLLGGLAGHTLQIPDSNLRSQPRVTEVSLLAPPQPAPNASDAKASRSQDSAVPVRPVTRRPAPASAPVLASAPGRQSDTVGRRSSGGEASSTEPPHLANVPAHVERARGEPNPVDSTDHSDPIHNSRPIDYSDQMDHRDPTRQAASGAFVGTEATPSLPILPSISNVPPQTASGREAPQLVPQHPLSQQPMPQQPVASLSTGLAGDPSVAVPALPPLTGSHARQFKVYWGDFEGKQSVARIRYRLTVMGDQYEVRTEGEAQGLISLVYSGTLTQISIGTMGPGGLVPRRYAESRGRSAERAVSFDPEASQLLPPGGTPLSVPRGIQDRLSVFYQLGLLARAQPAAFAPGQEVVVPVASLRDMRLERFQVVGDEVLMVPGAPMRALHLHRPPPAGSRDPKIDLWLGYDQQMLPVRLRVEDGSQRVLDQLVDTGE
jgi:hypothetical protein